MKKFAYIFIILNIITSHTKAEIAYIDINYILTKSDVGKFLQDHIDKIEDENTIKYTNIENKLIKKEKTLIAQQNILNKEEFEKKLLILKKEIQKYRSNKKESIDTLKKIRIDNSKKILKVLNPIITEYVDLNSISIVIPKKNIIVGKKKLDITNQIIKLLNDDIDRLNF